MALAEDTCLPDGGQEADSEGRGREGVDLSRLGHQRATSFPRQPVGQWILLQINSLRSRIQLSSDSLTFEHVRLVRDGLNLTKTW